MNERRFKMPMTRSQSRLAGLNRTYDYVSNKTLLDLSWEDVLFCYVLPQLSLKDCFNLRCVSRDFKLLVDVYFSRLTRIKIPNALKYNANGFGPLQLEVLLAGANHVQEIDFSYCNWIPADWFTDFFLKSENLRKLYLAHCVHYSMFTFRPLITNASILVELDLENCSWVDSYFIESVSLLAPNLEFLDLSRCTLVDSSMVFVIRNLKKLRNLNLSYITSITDVTVCAIACCLADIECLNLTGCHRICDEGVKAVGEKCQKLKYFLIYGCILVTESAVSDLRGRMYVHTSS